MGRIYKIKRIGPSTDPWGTPWVWSNGADKDDLYKMLVIQEILLYLLCSSCCIMCYYV